MAGIFNNDALYNSTQSAATNWQMNSPHSLYWQDVVSRIINSTGLQNVSPEARQLIAYLAATGQNTLLGLQDSGVINFNAGNPVADFIGTHRVLIARQLPITSYSIDGDTATSYGTSLSYGPGNNTLTAATLLHRAFAADFRNENNQIVAHRTQGVSSRSIDSWLPYIIDQPGFIKDGHIKMFNLSKARTADDLGSALDVMRSHGATEESLAKLIPVQNALRILDRENATNDTEAISLLKREGYDDSLIELTLLQRHGRNTNFLVQTEELRQIIKDTFTEIGENLKDLSDLFDTEDPAKLVAYARGAGLGNITDRTRAAEVREQLREIATIAATTGQSPQEVVRDRIQISNGLSAMYGGRVADKGAIDVVHTALVSAQQRGERSPYSREEAAAAAVRSVANVQNIYSGAILMKGVRAQALEMEGLDPAIADQMDKLEEEFESASLDDKPMVAMRMESFLRKHFGNQVVDNPSLVAHFMSKHGSTFLESHFQDIAIDNIKNRIATSGDVPAENAAALEWLAVQDVAIFGSRRDLSIDFNKLIREGDTNGAVDQLLAIGMTRKNAEEYVDKMSAYGVDKYNTHMGMYLFSADWLQQDNYSMIHKSGHEGVTVSRLLTASNTGSASREGILSILSGELAGGNITARSLAAAQIGLIRNAALNDATPGEPVDTTMQRFHSALGRVEGLRTVSFGKYSEDLRRFEFIGPDADAQREALRTILNVNDDDLNALLDNPAALETALNAAGYDIAGAVGVRGEMYAYNREDASNLANTYVGKYGGGLTRAFAAVNGIDSVSLREGANNTLERIYRVGDSEYTEEGLRTFLTQGGAEGFNLLYRLAAEGDQTAIGLLSDKFRDTITGDPTKPYNVAVPESFRSLLSRNTITVGDIKHAADAYWGTMNFSVLGTGEMDKLKAEGIADANGRYTRTIHVGGREFTQGAEVKPGDLRTAANSDDFYKALVNLLKDRTVDPRSEEWQEHISKIVETLNSIDGNINNMSNMRGIIW